MALAYPPSIIIKSGALCSHGEKTGVRVTRHFFKSGVSIDTGATISAWSCVNDVVNHVVVCHTHLREGKHFGRGDASAHPG